MNKHIIQQVVHVQLPNSSYTAYQIVERPNYAFGKNIPLVTTTSGQYAIPLTQAKQAINNLDRQSNSIITLTVSDIHEKLI